MILASETLIRTTWMANDPLINYHDAITPIDFDAIAEKAEATDCYSNNQLVMIAILEFLVGNSDEAYVSLDEIAALPSEERHAVLVALMAKWSPTELQENLE